MASFQPAQLHSEREPTIYTGKPLEDDIHTLGYYGIPRESTLNLLFHHFWIDVNLTEKCHTITIYNVNYITTIGDIKARINDVERITPDKQILSFNEKVLQDDGNRSPQHSGGICPSFNSQIRKQVCLTSK